MPYKAGGVLLLKVDSNSGVSYVPMFRGKLKLSVIRPCLRVMGYYRHSVINLCHSLGSLSRRQTDDILRILPQKTGFDFSCKLSLLETNCIKCQNLFSEKKKKTISMCCLLKFLPRVLSVKFPNAAIIPKYWW